MLKLKTFRRISFLVFLFVLLSCGDDSHHETAYVIEKVQFNLGLYVGYRLYQDKYELYLSGTTVPIYLYQIPLANLYDHVFLITDCYNYGNGNYVQVDTGVDVYINSSLYRGYVPSKGL